MLSVFHNRRWDTDLLTVRRLLDGALGRVVRFESRFERRRPTFIDNVRIACFAIVSVMAVLGGILLASRLRSVDTNTGGGQALLYPIAAAVIGGTSLFGGRGTMKAALLGAVVMLGIDNGLGLLGLSSGTKYVLTGGVLLLAVTVDSISRRGREASGRA